MASENTSVTTQDSKLDNHIGMDCVDSLSKELTQALAMLHMISEQYESPSSRYNDEIMSNAVWAVKSRIQAALDVVENRDD